MYMKVMYNSTSLMTSSVFSLLLGKKNLTIFASILLLIRLEVTPRTESEHISTLGGPQEQIKVTPWCLNMPEGPFFIP